MNDVFWTRLSDAGISTKLMKTKTQEVQTHCLKGHPLSGGNLQAVATRPGKRICKTCRTESSRAYSAKKEAGEKISPRTKHGHLAGEQTSHEYGVWSAMVSRCHRPSRKDYKDYGARGIEVAPVWRTSFKRFLQDVGTAPSREHSIDRFPDKQGNYEPGNVRWATRMEQAQNRKDNRNLTLNGVTQCISQWSRDLHLHEDTIRSRLKRGWDAERALQPIQQ